MVKKYRKGKPCGFSVFCADIGSIPKKHFGWFGHLSDGNRIGGTCICALRSAVATQLESGKKVAFGFEAPLFVPIPQSVKDLGKQRQGEKGRRKKCICLRSIMRK